MDLSNSCRHLFVANLFSSNRRIYFWVQTANMGCYYSLRFSLLWWKKWIHIEENLARRQSYCTWFCKQIDEKAVHMNKNGLRANQRHTFSARAGCDSRKAANRTQIITPSSVAGFGCIPSKLPHVHIITLPNTYAHILRSVFSALFSANLVRFCFVDYIQPRSIDFVYALPIVRSSWLNSTQTSHMFATGFALKRNMQKNYYQLKLNFVRDNLMRAITHEMHKRARQQHIVVHIVYLSPMLAIDATGHIPVPTTHCRHCRLFPVFILLLFISPSSYSMCEFYFLHNM